jgi:cytochrome c oxidase subunit I
MLGTIWFASWAHHMFATGMSFTEKTVFMIGTLAAVPASAMHVFNFIATMWGGRIKFAAPMLFAVGGIMFFYAAGAGGVVNTAIPLDFLTASYFVVGHFHLFMMGTVTMMFTGFIYYLFPMITGRMYNERAAQVQFVVALIRIALVFETQHILGLYGQPRRTFDYTPLPQFIIMNQIATIGAWMIGPAYGLMLINLIKSAVNRKPVENRDPFGISEQYYDYARREPHY